MKIINIENFDEFKNIFDDETIDYILINISASWCKPCQQIKEELNEFINNIEIKQNLNAVFLRIDYDLMEEYQDFQKYFQPNKIPYFYMYKDKTLITEFQSANMETIKKNITSEILEKNTNNFDLTCDF
jgi:thioredoxin-like negative regulator of GroEL